MAVYATVSEVREFTKVQAVEWDDTALTNLITRVTNQIDEKTGRTWQGEQTETDELYDGNGTDELRLKHCDINSVSALSIDDNDDGVFTDITTSYIKVYSYGKLILDDDAETWPFTKGYQNVKVSYKWGHTSVSDEVKDLCLLMCANKIHLEESRTSEIEQLIKKLKWKGFDIA